MDLAEAKDIKKRWQEYTEELYKKGLNDPDNHDGVITHLEPEKLWMEVYNIVQETGINTIPKKRNAKRQNGCLRKLYN